MKPSCYVFLYQSAHSSLRECTPSWVCTTGGRSTCWCPSAGLCTSASSRRPSPCRPTTSSSCSCGPSCRSPSWPCSSTSTGPGSSTCTALNQVRTPACSTNGFSVSSFVLECLFSKQCNITPEQSVRVWGGGGVKEHVFVRSRCAQTL